MNEIKINDIKHLVEIPDISFYMFIIICSMSLLVLISVCVLLYKKFNNKSVNIRKEYYEILQNLDFTNAKETSYMMSKYLRLLISTEQEKYLIEELIEDLDKYKYKKDVKEISNKVILKFELIMDKLDV